MPVEERSEPDAAIRASPTAVRPLRRASASAPGASRAASTTPQQASTMPAICRVPGRSPETSPTTTGIETPVAEIGATTLIVPIESAR